MSPYEGVLNKIRRPSNDAEGNSVNATLCECSSSCALRLIAFAQKGPNTQALGCNSGAFFARPNVRCASLSCLRHCKIFEARGVSHGAEHPVPRKCARARVGGGRSVEAWRHWGTPQPPRHPQRPAPPQSAGGLRPGAVRADLQQRVDSGEFDLEVLACERCNERVQTTQNEANQHAKDNSVGDAITIEALGRDMDILRQELEANLKRLYEEWVSRLHVEFGLR